VQLQTELAQLNTKGIVWKLIQVLRRVIEFDRKVTSGATVEIGCKKTVVVTGQRRLVDRSRQEPDRQSQEKPNDPINTGQPTMVFSASELRMSNVHALVIIDPSAANPQPKPVSVDDSVEL
jgi:hypothetical protein